MRKLLDKARNFGGRNTAKLAARARSDKSSCRTFSSRFEMQLSIKLLLLTSAMQLWWNQSQAPYWYTLSGPTHAKPFLPGKRGTDFGTWKAGSCTCQRIKDSSAGFALNVCGCACCAERAAGSVPLPGGSKSVMSETCKGFRTVSFFSGLLPPCARLFLPVPHWINVAVWKLA